MMSTDNDLRKLPPSREALIHHTKRACYQAGCIWRESIDNFGLTDPSHGDGEKNVTVIVVLCENQHK